MVSLIYPYSRDISASVHVNANNANKRDFFITRINFVAETDVFRDIFIAFNTYRIHITHQLWHLITHRHKQIAFFRVHSRSFAFSVYAKENVQHG